MAMRNGTGLFSALLAIPLTWSGTASAGGFRDVSVSATLGFESQYVFRGVQMTEESFQPGIEVKAGDFTLGAWAALPVSDGDLFGDEIDLYAGYSFTFSQDVSGSAGLTYYSFPDAQDSFFDLLDEEKGTGGGTLELWYGISLTETLLNPKLTAYYDFMLNTFTVMGNISHSIPLTDGLSVTGALTLGHIIDDDDAGDYSYGTLKADLAYAITDHISGSVGARYGQSTERTFFDDLDLGTFKKSSVWAGAALTAGF